MLNKIPKGYKDGISDKKGTQAKGLLNVPSQEVGVEKSSVLLDLDGKQSSRKGKPKKSQMKSNYRV